MAPMHPMNSRQQMISLHSLLASVRGPFSRSLTSTVYFSPILQLQMIIQYFSLT